MMNGFLLDGVCNPAFVGRGLQPRPKRFNKMTPVLPLQNNFAGRGLQPRPKRFNKMTPVLPLQNNLFQSINSID
jgi:CRISPR/Cas system endoribonuclease Cas6 (RAMP superfamily)